MAGIGQFSVERGSLNRYLVTHAERRNTFCVMSWAFVAGTEPRRGKLAAVTPLKQLPKNGWRSRRGHQSGWNCQKISDGREIERRRVTNVRGLLIPGLRRLAMVHGYVHLGNCVDERQASFGIINFKFLLWLVSSVVGNDSLRKRDRGRNDFGVIGRLRIAQ